MSNHPFKPCAVIPVYNHGATVGAVIAALRELDLPCLLVDDGSEATCAATLKALVSPGVTLLRRAENGGKGAAMQDGFRAAALAGYSHALQVDADGQHELNDVQRLLDIALHAPCALVGGQPIYGEDAPRARRYGRLLTTVWVWINTLSCDIPDAMCGFRIYPLKQVLPILSATGTHMEFDIAVLVRLHWAGVPMKWVPTQVRYPEDGISHFRGVTDNMLISLMHARLFFGMLVRAPRLVLRRVKSTR